MYTTIEEKLSAIKAINEEIAYVEESTSILAAQSTGVYYSLIGEGLSQAITITPDVSKKVNLILQEYFTERKKELIAKAEALMK